MGGGCEFKEEDCGCVSGDAGCQMPDVKDVCMGRSSCRLDVTQQYIGTGACHGFSDYMYIEFTCLPGMFAEVTCLPGMSAEVTCLQVYLLRSRAHEVCLLSLCEFQVHCMFRDYVCRNHIRTLLCACSQVVTTMPTVGWYQSHVLSSPAVVPADLVL